MGCIINEVTTQKPPPPTQDITVRIKRVLNTVLLLVALFLWHNVRRLNLFTIYCIPGYMSLVVRRIPVVFYIISAHSLKKNGMLNTSGSFVSQNFFPTTVIDSNSSSFYEQNAC